VRRWLELTGDIDGPDDAERYLIFQTLAGAWPIEPERLQAYMEKALREAKRTTSWVDPDEAHEAAVRAFVAALYEHEAFRADFDPFAAELALAGDRAALGQLLLKLTVPGLPDVYQGDELLSLSLVDPDNRRPVDWERRRELLEQLRRGAAPTVESRKLWLIMRTLVLRRTRAAAFAGGYEPLAAGPGTVAVLRGGEVHAAVAFRGDGDPGELPAGRWRDALHGGEHDGGAPVPLRDGIALLHRT
jgi:(1->4)-alpha-D-glucan 1-alpha-D-glucosylmutase